MQELIINFNRDEERQGLWRALRRLRGTHRLEISQYRKRRSDRQNRYYWPVFCKLLSDFMREQGENISPDDAHEIFKHKFLRREIIDEKTGEVIAYTASTTKLSTVEFNEYLDQIAYWLNDMFGLVVPEPTMYHETVTDDDNEQQDEGKHTCSSQKQNLCKRS